jgi:hypothetical protein
VSSIAESTAVSNGLVSAEALSVVASGGELGSALEQPTSSAITMTETKRINDE